MQDVGLFFFWVFVMLSKRRCVGSQMRVLCVLTLCGDAPGYAVLVRLGNYRVLDLKRVPSHNLLFI